MKSIQQHIKNFTICTIAAAVLLSAVPLHASSLNVTITVDNGYGFGFGDVNGIVNYYGGIRNTTAADIYWGPALPVVSAPPSPYTVPGTTAEIYTVPTAALSDYVYIVAWSDNSQYQGALAGFQLPGGPLLSGTGTWQVFATGIDLDSGVITDTLTAADVPDINAQIALANANAGGVGTSIGWVDENGLLPDSSPGYGELHIGPQNVANAIIPVHPAIPGIATDANWMWYNEFPGLISNPFQSNILEGPGGHQEYLIFRTQVEEFVPEPTSFGLAVLGIAGLLAFRRRKR